LKYQIDKDENAQREYNVGFIGAGKMAQALAMGLVQDNNMVASDMDTKILSAVKKAGLDITQDNLEVAENSDVVVLAVKPHIIPTILKQIAPVADTDQLFISIAAGVTIKSLEETLPEGTHVIRVMPNTPSLVRAGASVYSMGTHATEADSKLVEKLFSSIGTCDCIPEDYMDAVTGLSGSGPAYTFLALNAMADGGVLQGLPRDLATRLAAQTVMGAAKMVLETGTHPGQLKDNVTSPGGTTIHGVSILEDAGFRNSLIKAIEAATNRSKELSKE
jgi:pyrroline-5-carboxylate reductase